MRKRLVRLLALFAFLFMIPAVSISEEKKTETQDLYSQIELFSYALTTIQSEYVDEKSPQDLIYGSLQGMLASLDPHSQFLNPEDFQELKTETQGKFGGLGIEISIRDGLLTIITPLEDTPAWRAGLRAGDRIVKIGDEVTKDISLSDAVKKLRGEPGTEITITILREDEFKLHDFTIKREIIQIQDVKHTQILEDHIGYIRLTEFREDSYAEFHKALALLKEKKADSLILDLRNNPGGLLNVAIAITEEFLEEGKLIVSTRGRHPVQTTDTYAKSSPEKILAWPMVVLINKGSASGSEILAGALKDNKRAVILGEQSFGKGSVQSVIPLPDGSGLRLTTSKYLTPSGVSIHGTGITPDIIVEREYEDVDAEMQSEKKAEKIFSEFEFDENENEDPRKLEMAKKEKEVHELLMADNQIQSAISVLKGILVYQKLNGEE